MIARAYPIFERPPPLYTLSIGRGLRLSTDGRQVMVQLFAHNVLRMCTVNIWFGATDDGRCSRIEHTEEGYSGPKRKNRECDEKIELALCRFFLARITVIIVPTTVHQEQQQHRTAAAAAGEYKV